MHKTGYYYRYILNLVNRTLWSCVLIGLGILMLPPIISIIKRIIVGTGLVGTVEIGEYLLVMIGFFGLAYTQHLKGHIAVDVIYDRFGKKWKSYFDIISLVICSLFSITFVYIGYQKALSATLGNETAWFGDTIVPVWFMRWVVPIGFAVLCLQLFLELIEQSKKTLNN
jgi:C4-dicarboxylate transporter DctQ subunit